MAKSYVTQFTEYVSKQQDSLRGKLKAKGLSPSPNATLGSLVSDLDSLQESFGTDKYERDPNFPDIDTMFDNDPLRAANGGPYAGCAYFIKQVDGNGKVGFAFAAKPTSTSIPQTYYGEKVIVSDGAEYENVTSSPWIHTVDPSGIFYGEDGFPYCLLKIYRTDFVVLTYNNIGSMAGTIEWIEDTFVGLANGSNSTNTISGYGGDPNALEYLRYVGSHVTEENIGTIWYAPSANINYLGAYTLKHFRVDGLHRFTGFLLCPAIKKIVFNGQISNTITSWNMGVAGVSSYPLKVVYLDYLKLPSSDSPMTSIVYTYVKSLFIPDNYTNVNVQYNTGNSGNGSPAALEELHLGSGLSNTLSFSSYFRNLKHITTSENIYSINTSAITLDFSTCYLLTKQSILNLFNGVADRTGMTANIIKLPARIKSFLTDEEKAILTNKNWTLS